MNDPGHLALLRDSLLDRRGRASLGRRSPYAVPRAWLAPLPERLRPGDGSMVPVADPFGFYAGLIDAILREPPRPLRGEEEGGETARRDGAWSRSAVVYNLMVRYSTAVDHDGDGRLGVPLNEGGWRETGTFLKTIALLPWIRSLGANTLHLLPVQEIGEDGRRGELGSPYAVRDPLAFDPMLGEPAVGIGLETQFAAMVEAARRSGLRVVLELPLRTAAKDCIWAQENPGWFYWIPESASFQPPRFSAPEIAAAERRIAAGDRDGLPEPSPEYRSLFRAAPDPATVRKEGARWVGSGADGGRIVIPGAFADWPPDDRQPVWGDVTYLKYFQDERHNYPAYNTVRMYPSSLLEGPSAALGLWDRLAGVVARYAREYRIDGLMIDMAHALPPALTRMIVSGARAVNPDFAFWAEDFDRTPGQVASGYNVVLGGQWACQHRPSDFASMVSWLGRTPGLPPHLASPETHNTPRAAARTGGALYARHAWAVSCLLPGIPFLHSGFELNETRPVNTGLDFTPAELERFPAGELPLFSAHALGWDVVGAPPDWITGPLGIRGRYGDCLRPGAGLRMIGGAGEGVLAFVRFPGTDGGEGPGEGARGADPPPGRTVLVAANTDLSAPAPFEAGGLPEGTIPVDLFSGVRFESTGDRIRGILAPGQVAAFAAEGG